MAISSSTGFASWVEPTTCLDLFTGTRHFFSFPQTLVSRPGGTLFQPHVKTNLWQSPDARKWCQVMQSKALKRPIIKASKHGWRSKACSIIFSFALGRGKRKHPEAQSLKCKQHSQMQNILLTQTHPHHDPHHSHLIDSLEEPDSMMSKLFTSTWANFVKEVIIGEKWSW